MDSQGGEAASGTTERVGNPGIQLCVTTSELTKFSSSEAASNLDRLEADTELVFQLALRGYRGVEWNRFATALAKYGFQVISTWARTRFIFAKCAAKGVGLGDVFPRRLRDDYEELACETVAEAIAAFRTKILIPGRWDPTRGASLKTFFVGQCIFQFPNVYRRWLAELDIPPVNVDSNRLAYELALKPRPAAPDKSAELSRAYCRLSHRDPRMLRALEEIGFTQAEIASRLNTTTRAIESRVYRYSIKKKRERRPQ